MSKLLKGAEVPTALAAELYRFFLCEHHTDTVKVAVDQAKETTGGRKDDKCVRFNDKEVGSDRVVIKWNPASDNFAISTKLRDNVELHLDQ